MGQPNILKVRSTGIYFSDLNSKYVLQANIPGPRHLVLDYWCKNSVKVFRFSSESPLYSSFLGLKMAVRAHYPHVVKAQCKFDFEI